MTAGLERHQPPPGRGETLVRRQTSSADTAAGSGYLPPRRPARSWTSIKAEAGSMVSDSARVLEPIHDV